MQNTGLNNTTLKQQNRGLILKLIATGECTSRIELARRTGLSKMAASNIIGMFLEDRVIVECKTMQVEGKGRNPIRLCISPDAPKMLGIYINRDECSVVLCDLQLKVLKKSGFILMKDNGTQLFTLLCQAIDAVLKDAKEERIYGIGIGSLGPVDTMRAVILNPPNFYGIRDLKIVSMLKEKYNMPVYLDSQYNCAALAEKYYGNGKQEDEFIFMGIANGIGSGIISNGSLSHNASGFTSELGHTSIEWNGQQCTCGNKGCLELYAASPVIEEKLSKITGKKSDFANFCKWFEETNDKEAEQIFQDMTEHLACGVTNMVNLFNPQKVIIGNRGYWIPYRFIQDLEKKINERKLSGQYRYVKVEKSFFQEDTHIRGCACSLLMQLFDGALF